MRIRSIAAALLPLSLLSVAACGDDAPKQAATAVPGDAFCTAAAALDAKSDALDSQDPFSMAPEALQKAVTELTADGKRLAAQAPADVRALMLDMSTKQQALVDMLAANNWDFTAAASDPAFLAAADAQSDVNDQVDAYMLDKCGIDTEGSSDSTPDSTPSSLPAGLVTRENFLELYAMGADVEITDEMKACFLAEIADVTDEQLEGAMGGSGDQDVLMQVGLAVITCNIPIAGQS